MDPYLEDRLSGKGSTTAYDRGRYARKLRYDRPLVPALAPEDDAWARELRTEARRWG
jgi:hypothetical protein